MLPLTVTFNFNSVHKKLIMVCKSEVTYVPDGKIEISAKLQNVRGLKKFGFSKFKI